MQRRQTTITGLILTLVLALMPAAASGQSREDNNVGAGGTPGTAENFELVGHEPLFGRGMNAGIALYGDYVYIGNRTDGSDACGIGDPRREEDPDSCPHEHPGVLIVDASDPTDPEVVGEVGYTPDEVASLVERNVIKQWRP